MNRALKHRVAAIESQVESRLDAKQKILSDKMWQVVPAELKDVLVDSAESSLEYQAVMATYSQMIETVPPDWWKLPDAQLAQWQPIWPGGGT